MNDLIRPAIIVHGGAGNDYDDRVEDFRLGVAQAARAGWEVLSRGGPALEAVEAAIFVLEDNPTFDAGTGSYINSAGEVEMDAILMDGITLRSGAVAGLQRVRNPIHVARLVMECTRHSLLVGSGAETFARSMGVPEYPMELLVRHSSTHLLAPEHRFVDEAGMDTVGAIALDQEGHLIVGTSTGGTADKLPGRVGDSPQIGCGAYADIQLGAAAATGTGEDLMKLVISKAACDHMGRGLSAQEAAEAMIRQLTERIQGSGGIIVMNPQGQVGAAYNTHHMVHAWICGDGVLQVRD